jgi:hypothetical protein
MLIVLLPPIILKLGEKRFGPAPAALRAAIEAITDVERLDVLLARLPEAQTWDELLKD